MNWLMKLLWLGKAKSGAPGAPPAPATGPSPSPPPAAAEPGTPWEQLLAAIRSGDFFAMRDLVSDDLSLLRKTDDDGATALHHAALGGSTDFVRYLIECEANVEARDRKRGARPIDWANEAGHTPVVQLLFGHGASATLHEAAAYGLVERVRTALEEDTSQVNEASGYGTPLHYAVLWGQLEITRLLLDAGADAQAKNQDGKDAAAIAQDQLESRGDRTSIAVGSRRSELAAGWTRCLALLAERAAGE